MEEQVQEPASADFHPPKVGYITIDEKIEEFKRQNNSLRLAASSISAMAGFHPYISLPTLLRELVYKGLLGQLLLSLDLEALGLTMKSDNEVLFDLAKKAGKKTEKALTKALQVKAGTKVLDNTQAAAVLKKKILEEAVKSKKLKKVELKKLQDGARGWIDTGYGKHHENAALDLYEKRCGWEVRDRNADIVSLSFDKLENFDCLIPNDPPTVVEMESSDDEMQIGGVTSKLTDIPDETKIKKKLTQITKQRPFFTILGCIDGIRDELWCPPNQGAVHGSLDEDWQLRSIIVECKLRMNQAYNLPPLYDQIQTITYCLMYKITEADLIQVIRSRPEETGQQLKESPLNVMDKKATQQCPSQNSSTETRNPVLQPHDISLGNPKQQSLQDSLSAPHESSQGSHEHTSKDSNDEKKIKKSVVPTSVVDIVVSRISLDDPIMQHRSNWEKVILPRLRSFVDAVYTIRGDDEQRHRLLLCESRDERLEAWELLHKHCPWLVDCDTAYHRELQALARSPDEQN